MSLKFYNGKVEGEYRYTRIGTPIILSGTYNGRIFELAETVAGEVTGFFEGTLHENRIEGLWFSGDRSDTLSFAAAVRILQLVEPRMYGEDVRAIQRILADLGVLSVNEIDGWYGPITISAINRLRRYLGFQESDTVDIEFHSFMNNGIDNNMAQTIHAIETSRWESLRRIETDRMAESTEGGHLIRYLDNGEIKRGILTYYGEIGKVEYDFFIIDSHISVLLKKEYMYKEPIYFDTFNIDDAKITYTTVWKIGGNIYGIDNGRFSQTDVDFRKIEAAVLG